MITPSHYPHTGRLSLGTFQQTIRVFIHPHALPLPPLYFPWIQFPDRLVLKGAISRNCDICTYDVKLYYLPHLSFNRVDFPE